MACVMRSHARMMIRETAYLGFGVKLMDSSSVGWWLSLIRMWGPILACIRIHR